MGFFDDDPTLPANLQGAPPASLLQPQQTPNIDDGVRQALLGMKGPLPNDQLASAAPPPDPHISLLNSLRYAPDLIAKKFGQGLMNAVAPLPPGMEGLFSPDQISRAQHQGLLDFGLSMLANSRSQGYGEPAPSFGQALASGVQAGRGGVQAFTTGALQNQMSAMGLAQQLRIMQARQSIGQNYAPQPGESRTAMVDRLMSMYTQYARVGDLESMKALNDVISKLGEDPRLWMMQHQKEPIQVDLGGRKMLLDPWSWQPLGNLNKSPEPVNPQTFNAEEQQRRAERTATIGGQYIDQTKEYRTVADNLGNVTTQAKKAVAGDPAAQWAVMDSFLRTLNPGSTVRQGQMIHAEDARGIPDWVVQHWNQLASGATLSPNQTRRFINAMVEVAQRRHADYGRLAKTYKQWAGSENADTSFFNDPFKDADWTAGGMYGSQNGSPAAPGGAKRGTPGYISQYEGGTP